MEFEVAGRFNPLRGPKAARSA